VVMAGGAGGRGFQGGRTVGDLRDEELGTAIDLEIEKVRRTTYRPDFSRGSLCCWTTRECLRGTSPTLAVTPVIHRQDAGASQSSTSPSGTETEQNMIAHSQRQAILRGEH